MQIPVATMTRQQLYDEIWQTSAAGVAKKYGISYPLLLRQIKDAHIPIPPSGYWTKLSFGKSVEKIPLNEPFDKIIELFAELTVSKNNVAMKTEAASNNAVSADTTVEKGEEVRKAKEPDIIKKMKNPAADKPEKISDIAKETPETITQWGKTINIYDRETLYNEVWEYPVTEVAKKYKVSDVSIHKVCKSLDIPTPDRGYWAKKKAGKLVSKTPLPKSDKPNKKKGAQTKTGANLELSNRLPFGDAEEQKLIFAVASQILIPDEDEKMHPTVIAYRKKVNEWIKQQNDAKSTMYVNRRNRPEAPALSQRISESSIPRACRIIDALIKAMEPLGVELTENLGFKIGCDVVGVSFSETQDQIKHVLTKAENLQMLKYEEEKKKWSWASKPKIPTYDYVYNGRLSISINNSKAFRDCKSYVLEDKLGDIMLEIYLAADVIKQQRLEKEEAERQRREAAKRAAEERERYNAEVERTNALVNEAEDYDIACKIRAYIASVENGPQAEEKTDWIKWAKKKADWLDPTIKAEDSYFGVRRHRADRESKKLSKRYY